MDLISVRDTFFHIVEKTNKLLKKQDLIVYPQCANIREICAELTNMDKSVDTREKKYPGIFLLKDYAEAYTNLYDTQILTKVQILIVADSKKDYSTDEREQNVFKPTLYPICAAFLKSAEPYLNFTMERGFQKIDRGFISGALSEAVAQNKERNLFNDMLDGIELQNLPLLIQKTC